MTYAALWCKTNYSFLEGASFPSELVEEAHSLGLGALAITDRDGVYGIVRAHVAAEELGFKLLFGAQITVGDAPRTGAGDTSRGHESDTSQIVLLARDRAGYASLCQLVTTGRLRSAKGASVVSWRDVCAHARGLAALWGGNQSLLVREDAPEWSRVAGELRDAFGEHLHALVARHHRAEEHAEELRLRARARHADIPLVAGHEILYHRPDRRRVQDVLTCIRHGVSLSTAGRKLRVNAEHGLKGPAALRELFRDDPAALEHTRAVAASCTFTLSELRYRYPLEQLPDGSSASSWLRKLTFDGARTRYGGECPADVAAQLERELAVIDALDYGGYFLTMYEIVRFCRAQSILCQGRGSAANSAVCYCLGITAIDPVRMGLLFERFLSLERAEPPDIDLDIEHERREEVIQHVYAKHGRTHAAMVANVIRYRTKSALRDVGKALGFSESALLRVSELHSHWDGVDAANFAEAGFDVSSPAALQLLELANELDDFPRHLSIHPGGFLLGHEPIATLVPVENGTMEARTVIQWDKDDVEALGLFKVDLLGLGALTHLHRTFDLVRTHRGVELTMATIPADDPATYDQICRADTVGVFQIESRAQMSMLPRLKPRNYYDLVIEVSIVRPGPITGGMVHPYLRRRNKEEKVVYPHPCLEPVLAKTLGVPLFQEQVMRLAVVAADYTPGESDQLRRDMAAWRKSGRIEQHRERLISRMQKKGIALEFAERVFQQICGFGEYGFPESHAASFALISYVGAWLRRHHTAEFTCGLLNSLPMGFYSAATIVDDAKRHGVEFRPVDVCASEWDSTLEPHAENFALRMGLRFVKQLGFGEWMLIESARRAAPFTSLTDFRQRVPLRSTAARALAESGALESLEHGRREALWRVGTVPGTTPPHSPPKRGDSQERGAPRSSSVTNAAESFQAPYSRALFSSDDADTPAFPVLTESETVRWDYQSSHHSVRNHPLATLRAELTAAGLPDAKTIATLGTDEVVRYAGIVICRQRPGTASGVTFMTLEDESGFVNLIFYRDVFERFAVLGKTQGFLGVTGRVQNENGVVHVLVTELWVPAIALQVVEVGSRDFH